MARYLDMYGNYCRIDWYRVLNDIKDVKLVRSYYAFASKHPGMSKNRWAYYVIKKRFSTTALSRFKEYVKRQLPGVALCVLLNEVKYER